MKKFIACILTLLLPSMGYALGLEDGEICINSMQCKSKVCRHDSILGVARCQPKATRGEACSKSSLSSGSYEYSPCSALYTCDTTLKDKYSELSGYSHGWCVDSSAACEICDIVTSWTAATTGYESRYVGGCAAPCTFSTQYRCAAGYYGNPTTGSSGCTRCPSDGNASGKAPAGATSITQCYITSGTYTNSIGTFEISADCDYTL